MPGYGYTRIFLNDIKIESSSFLFDVRLLKDLKTIQIKFKNKIVYEIQFKSKIPYTLEINQKQSNDIEEITEIKGSMKSKKFNLQITQYNDINRLEFTLDSSILSEIVIIPKIQIEEALINYPFGIEKTKRTKIQSLDFLWLKGLKRGLIYIQKNSQKFIINQETFRISNLIPAKGRYEFCISITENQSPLFFVYTYYFRLIGHKFDKETNLISLNSSFLALNPPVPTVNLWQRENSIFLRLFNPSDDKIQVELKGDLIKHQIKETNFNLKEMASLSNKIIEMQPWKIKTLKF